MDDSPSARSTLKASQIRAILTEMPQAMVMLLDGRVEVGSDAHVALMELNKMLSDVSGSSVLTPKEMRALSTIVSGMTSPQARGFIGSKSNASTRDVRSRCVRKVGRFNGERR